MATQSIFKRYELKYMLTRAQWQALLEVMQNYMQADQYGRYQIHNIYFDTPDYQIIRNSLEKPMYKEKLRLRQYGTPSADKMAFIELKKKYKGVVYKRRIDLPQHQAIDYLWRGEANGAASQILSEIDYFKATHPTLMPRVHLSYEREAYAYAADDDFRVTFDFNIKMRDTDVTLSPDAADKPVLSDEYVLMEVKTVRGVPLWFAEALSKLQIYKTSFSKYGTAYQTYILPQMLCQPMAI